MSLTQQQTERYARNILLEPIGQAGQEKLLASSVLIVGAGGLGSPAALYLAAAGVGTIGLLDVDNFATKFLINDACCLQRVPFSHAGILRFEGQLMTVLPGRTACYRCVFGRPPSSESVPPSSRAGVLGVVSGVIGTLQATEAIKSILGIGDLLTDCLLTYDALAMRFRKVRVKRNPRCPLCSRDPVMTALRDP